MLAESLPLAAQLSSRPLRSDGGCGGGDGARESHGGGDGPLCFGSIALSAVVLAGFDRFYSHW